MDPHPFTEGPDGLCECGLVSIAAVHTAPQAHARTTDPGTSHAAAASLTPTALRASQRAVLDVLGRLGPATDVALVAAYHREAAAGYVPRQSDSGIRTRRSELAEDGRVVDTGTRERLPSGRWATVWRTRAADPHNEGATP